MSSKISQYALSNLFFVLRGGNVRTLNSLVLTLLQIVKISHIVRIVSSFFLLLRHKVFSREHEFGFWTWLRIPIICVGQLFLVKGCHTGLWNVKIIWIFISQKHIFNVLLRFFIVGCLIDTNRLIKEHLVVFKRLLTAHSSCSLLRILHTFHSLLKVEFPLFWGFLFLSFISAFFIQILKRLCLAWLNLTTLTCISIYEQLMAYRAHKVVFDLMIFSLTRNSCPPDAPLILSTIFVIISQFDFELYRVLICFVNGSSVFLDCFRRLFGHKF